MACCVAVSRFSDRVSHSGATSEVEQLLATALKKHTEAAKSSKAKKAVLSVVDAVSGVLSEVASWKEALADEATACEKEECLEQLREACSAFVSAKTRGVEVVRAVKSAWAAFQCFQEPFQHEGFTHAGFAELEKCLFSRDAHVHVSELMQLLSSMEAVPISCLKLSPLVSSESSKSQGQGVRGSRLPFRT